MDDPSTVPTRKRARGKKDASTAAAAAAGARKRSAFAARNLISRETARHQGATKISEEDVVVVVEDEDEDEDDVEEVEIGAERKGKEGEEEDLEGEEGEEEDHQVVVSQGPPAKRRRTVDGWDEDEDAVLWVARVHASGKSHLETVNLGRECSFQNLQRTVAATRRNLNLPEGTVLVDTSGVPLTEETWNKMSSRRAILRERGAPLNIKNRTSITPVPNIISSFIVDIQPLVCLTEIIDNSIEATSRLSSPEKDRTIIIKTDPKNRTVIIQDNGCGMGQAELEEFGKLGHTTHAKATSTRIVAPPYHLSSEFGRYGIGAKSAGLGLGSGYRIESKRKSDTFVHYKEVSKEVIMREGWEAEVGFRSPEKGEEDHFTRFTINDVMDSFWETNLQRELRPFLADTYHFYLHGPPKNKGLVEPDLTGFTPVNILVDGQPLRETTGNIKDFIDKANPELIWQFAIDVPDNLLAGVDRIWGFICYYPIINGQETLPVPYELVFDGDVDKAYQQHSLRMRDPGLNYFWVGRLFPKIERKRFLWMQPSVMRKVPTKEQLKLPNQCFDRIKGAIFFPRNMVATSHKQQFAVNEKLLEYLYKEPRELDETTPGGQLMASQYKKLRKNFRKILQHWHTFDAEAIPLGIKVHLEGPKKPGVGYYNHIQFRGVEYKVGDKVRIVENKKTAEYGEIQVFELDRSTKNVKDNVIVVLWTHEKTDETKELPLGMVEKISEHAFKEQIRLLEMRLPSHLDMTSPTKNHAGERIIVARETAEIAVVVEDKNFEAMERPPFGVLFESAVEVSSGENLLKKPVFLPRPLPFKGYDKGTFFFTLQVLRLGAYLLTFVPGTMEKGTDSNPPASDSAAVPPRRARGEEKEYFRQHKTIKRLQVTLTAIPGAATNLSARWAVEGEPLLLLGGALPRIKLQQKDKNKVLISFPEDLRTCDVSIEGQLKKKLTLDKTNMKVVVDQKAPTDCFISGLVIVPSAARVRLKKDVEVELSIQAESRSTSITALLTTGIPTKMTISTVGPEKNVYAMGEFLPRLSITLEDQFGNLSRAPIRARVLHCYGCEAEKQTFKIKGGEKTLSARFFEVISEYGMASFDILIGDHLVDTRTYPIGPVFLRLYVDGEPVQTDLKGPDGEEVLVVEAGKELRGFEVWLVNAQDRPVASMTSPQTLALVLAKNTNKPKSYRFRAGKTKISGINAAKQVDRNYSLDFYVPALKDHPMAPHLGIILRTAPGAPVKLGTLTIENSAHPARISCGDETNLSVQLLDQFDNIVPLESLKTAYHNMLMRGLELRYLKEGRLAAAYNYDASKWCISASLKLEYTGLVIAGEDICGDATLRLSYVDTPVPEGQVKDEAEKGMEIALDPASLDVQILPGPIHDVIAEPEDLTTEAGHELQPITWRVVDQWKHVIESTKGRIVLLENPELHVAKQSVQLTDGRATFTKIKPVIDVPSVDLPVTANLNFRFEGEGGDCVAKSLSVTFTASLVPADVNCFLHGENKLQIQAGRSLGVVHLELVDQAGNPFSRERMVSLSFGVMGHTFQLEEQKNLDIVCSHLEAPTDSDKSFPMRICYIGPDSRTCFVEKLVQVIPAPPRQLVIEGRPIMDKICLENKPVTLALVLRLADEFGNLYTQKEQQLQGLTIKPVLHTDPSGGKELRPVRFGPDGRAQFAETLTLLPGAYRLVFTCEPSPTATGTMDIEALTSTFTAVDVMRMREQNKKLLEQSVVVKSDHADLTSRLSQTSQAITQTMREKTELERSVAAKDDRVRRMSQDLEAKQREATAALAVINAPPSEPRLGADARPDYRILRFKELESTLPAGQRSHIRGIVREKIKVHNVRLANMLAYHWGFDRLCQILVEGKDTLRALTDWEQRTKTYIDLLDIGDFEPKLGFVQAALTSSEDPTDDPAFVKFQYDRHRGFQPSANGQMFPMINENSDFARQVNQCLSKASFLINCLYIPQGARRWRPLFFKILTQNMLVFHTEADLYAYIHLTKDSTSCMSLDPQRRTGGTVKTMAYRPHLFEKNQNRTPSAFLEGLDDREMQSKQFLMSLREGRELVAVKQWEKDTREATERLREEEAQLRHLAVRLQQLQQQEGELKAKLASLNQQAQRINTELRPLGEQA